MDKSSKKQSIPKVISLFPGFEVIEFPWGAAVKNMKTEQWTGVFFPDGQELDVENWEVVLHDNGIEFISFKRK